MRKILVLAKKELVELFRETSGFLFMFLMPAALLVVFNLTLGGAYGGGSSDDNQIRMTIANMDKGPKGAELVQQLDALQWIETETTGGEDGDVPLTDEQVRRAVLNGVRQAAIVIPEDFSEKLGTAEKPVLRVLADPGVPVQFIGPLEGALAGTMYAVQFGFDMSVMSAQSLQAEIKREPVKKDSDEEKDQQFPSVYQQNLSGYSVMSIFFLIMSIGTAFINEKDVGTFTRILAAPMNKATYLAGKLVPYLLIAILQVALLIVLSIILYKTPIGNDLLALVLITLCTAAASCGLGLLMVTLFPQRGKFEGIAIVVILILTAFSGSFVPRFVLPESVQQASLFIPQSWSLIAYQDIMVRNMTVIDILPHCGVILGFAAVFFLFGVWRFKFK